eukprot:TRINITY_DN1439_c0_g3_i3.p1 TRINITY_DN1439_c0_g3~~TRINITY_DN1439_c0_g3_i3.p1  ORF type:complete len:240 (-),score=51.90 TRINITY_DN1439_c0_g3_i3:370-1089(-)
MSWDPAQIRQQLSLLQQTLENTPSIQALTQRIQELETHEQNVVEQFKASGRVSHTDMLQTRNALSQHYDQLRRGADMCESKRLELYDVHTQLMEKLEALADVDETSAAALRELQGLGVVERDEKLLRSYANQLNSQLKPFADQIKQIDEMGDFGQVTGTVDASGGPSVGLGPNATAEDAHLQVLRDQLRQTRLLLEQRRMQEQRYVMLLHLLKQVEEQTTSTSSNSSESNSSRAQSASA